MIEIVRIFFAIFVVMDSLGNLPVFFSFTKNMGDNVRRRVSLQTILVAAIILLIFLFFGNSVLDFFNIDIHSFKIAAGLILMIFGLKLVLGLRVMEERAKKYRVAVVPLATPLITGPGVITTIIVFAEQYGMLLTLIASLLNIVVAYYFLYNAKQIYKFLGRQGSDALSRIMGLILTAIAVSFIRQGWMNL